MNRLGMSIEKTNEYIEKCKDQISKHKEIREAIEQRGEFYPGELNCAIENIKVCKIMLELLETNRF